MHKMVVIKRERKQKNCIRAVNLTRRDWVTILIILDVVVRIDIRLHFVLIVRCITSFGASEPRHSLFIGGVSDFSFRWKKIVTNRKYKPNLYNRTANYFIADLINSSCNWLFSTTTSTSSNNISLGFPGFESFDS